MGAHTRVGFSMNISVSGWTPMGVYSVTWSKNSGDDGNVAMAAFWLTGSTANVEFTNYSAQTPNITARIGILYVKNSAYKGAV